MLVAFLVLYPDGQFVPRWSLFLAVIAFFLTAAWGLFPNAFFEIASPLGIFGAVGVVVVTGASLYVQSWRYRHHFSPIQRQQAKWFVFALAVFLVSTFLYFVLSIQSDRVLTPTESVRGDLATMTTGTLSSVFIPIAVGIAILRYRLYDIEIIIRKTLIYAALTALLALVYFGSVVLLQRLFGSWQGVAPVPRWQLWSRRWPSPRCSRRCAAASRTASTGASSARSTMRSGCWPPFAITSRDETDLDTLTAELTRVVQETG